MHTGNVAIGLAIVWFVVSFLNMGALNGDCWGEFGEGYDRHEFGANLLFAMMPLIGTLAAVFVTGFFEHGFSWRIPARKGRPLRSGLTVSHYERALKESTNDARTKM